ncbi:MAG: sugar ABC transporter permease, partial [Chloroflexota bacterium]
MTQVAAGSETLAEPAPPARWTQIRTNLTAWGFMGPAGVLVTLFFFIPVIILLWVSLTNMSSSNFGHPDFIGLGNYTRLFRDKFFPKILGNTFFYVVLTLSLFNVGLALTLALLTTHINRRAGFFFRVIWLLPRLTPSVIYIMMWKRLVADEPFGIINQLLVPFGVEARFWLNDNPWLFVILVNGFVGASFGMIIFTSAIESIPKDYVIAAKVDGASTLQIIRDITLP